MKGKIAALVQARGFFWERGGLEEKKRAERLAKDKHMELAPKVSNIACLGESTTMPLHV